MRPARWKLVERMLSRSDSQTGQLVLAVAPPPLDVLLYETPVLLGTQPPHNPLRGFIQEAVSLLGSPTGADVSRFLQLPSGVVEVVLGNLRQLGGLNCDDAGRWSVPDGAPQFRSDRPAPLSWRRTRRLLCFWPAGGRMLPLLPRMRLRDLVRLDAHNLRGAASDWYRVMQAWAGSDAVDRGKPTSLQLLPLNDGPPTQRGDAPDRPLNPEDVLVCRCLLDVIALTWAVRRDGVWEIRSRLWSRPTPDREEEGEPLAAAESWTGVSLPEQLLGTDRRLDRLASLFDPKRENWAHLIGRGEGAAPTRRDLSGSGPAILIQDGRAGDGQGSHWLGLHTTLGPDARLLCFVPGLKSRAQDEPGRPAFAPP